MGSYRSDVIIIHPPAQLDLGRGTGVPIPAGEGLLSSPAMETYPPDLPYVAAYLEKNGVSTQIVNLARLNATNPRLSTGSLLSGLRAKLFCLVMDHLYRCRGSLEVAAALKEAHPQVPLAVFGEVATHFNQELASLPQVDYVIAGDSVEEPLLQLLESVSGKIPMEEVPNLSFRDASGQVRTNPAAYLPASLDYLGDGMGYFLRRALRRGERESLPPLWNWHRYPVLFIPVGRGCNQACLHCGSAAGGEPCGRERMALRPPERIVYDIEIASKVTTAPLYLVGDLRQGGENFALEVLGLIAEVDPTNHLVFDLFLPPERDFLERMASSMSHFNLRMTPLTHDEELRVGLGKPYTNEELEQLLGWAMDAGCSRFYLYFRVGLPGQDPQSIRETVEYCGELLRRFGPRVHPLISPVYPNYPPGSAIFHQPERFGVTMQFGSLSEQAQALRHPHWGEHLGYETRWMGKGELVVTTYEALIELNAIKAKSGLIPPRLASQIDRFYRDALSLLRLLEETGANWALTPEGRPADKLSSASSDLLARFSLTKRELMLPLHGYRFHPLRRFRYALGLP